MTTVKLPKGVKFRTPPRGSAELDRFYDLVFSPIAFDAGWYGRIGHYAYDDTDGERAAREQDGFIYLWPTKRSGWTSWRMSANPEVVNITGLEFIEINW